MMLKKGLILGIWLSLALLGKGQVSITLQIPPQGGLVKNQLWNMLLVNSSSVTLVVRINLVLLDEKNNQPVLTATTMPITLPRGATQIQAKNLGPIEYVYGDPAYHLDGNPNGLLPAGSFQACYTVQTALGKPATLVENCLQLNVDPLSPPILNYPPDSGRIYTFYPQFSWLPPTPLGIFNDLSYDMVLVEVLPGQTPGDAIQFNVPMYNGSFIKDLYLNYPSSFRSLDTGKTYAWRIVALNGAEAEGMSDIWTFRVVANIPYLKNANKDSYVSLKMGQDPSVTYSGNTFQFAYRNMALDTSVTYRITSIQEKGNPLVQQGILPLKYGQNLIRVPLNNGYQQNKVYLFQLVNRRNETWALKFTWVPTSNPNNP
jgi:hypothetical protein